jgi:hypothetical protein
MDRHQDKKEMDTTSDDELVETKVEIARVWMLQVEPFVCAQAEKKETKTKQCVLLAMLSVPPTCLCAGRCSLASA